MRLKRKRRGNLGVGWGGPTMDERHSRLWIFYALLLLGVPTSMTDVYVLGNADDSDTGYLVTRK